MHAAAREGLANDPASVRHISNPFDVKRASLAQASMPGVNDHWQPPVHNPLDDHLFDLYLNHAIEQAAARGDRAMGGR